MLIIDNKMNIRRFKKKKCAPLNRNEQEMAKDRLFEISYYCDEKYVDESHFLAADHRLHDTELQKQKRSQELQRIIRSKCQRTRSPSRLPESKLEGRHGEATAPRHFEKCIFNLLESNSVFVGSKEKETISKDIIVIESRKRMQTMPELTKHEGSVLGKKLKTEETERMGRQLFSTNYHKFPRVSLSLNKRNYGRLKQQLRYDLFVKSLNCTIQCQ